jgi:aryl-alcohol dehydrogenase-like predicted oxidoreductase
VEQMANDKKVSRAQIALAWVLSQNDEIVTIPGTRKIHRLEENLGAFKVELTDADLAVIKNSLPSETMGSRY